MKVLAINFSPKKESGNTAGVLFPFLEGMRAASGEVELLNASDLNIERCCGLMSCHYQTPGICRQKDDLANSLLAKAKAADVWVLAFPVYGDTAPGLFHDVLLRLVMLQVEAYMEKADGYFRHPLRDPRLPHQVVFVVTSGYPESDRYTPLWQHLENFCRHRANLLDFRGIVYRPSGPVFAHLLALKEAHALDVQAASRSAGRALLSEGMIPEECLARIRQALIDDETLMRSANEMIGKMLAA